MKSKKPINSRWQEEIEFMQSPGFRVVFFFIALAMMGYCVIDWIILKGEHNKLLKINQEHNRQEHNRLLESNPSGYVPPLPSPPFKNEDAPSTPAKEVMVRDEDTPSPKPTPQWDWEGDIEIAGAVDQEVDDEDLSDAELDDIEIELVQEESAALRKKSDKAQREAEEMLSHAMPLLVDQLNDMSTDEQRRFLSELKGTMIDYFPPTLKKLAEEDSTIAQEGWKSFMTQLKAYGFSPPD